MRERAAGLIAALALNALALNVVVPGTVRAEAPRVVSLDQCADQYVLALVPRERIMALSPRARAADSHLREQADGIRRLRPSLEAMIAARPDVVVRYWGGDARLIQRLRASGVEVVEIAHADDFDAVRAGVLRVGAALGNTRGAEALIAQMDQRLERASGGGRGQALYVTPGGYTSGPGTLIDAMLRAAGFDNAERRAGFRPYSLERLILEPPARLVMGFFDNRWSDWRGTGRHPRMKAVAARTGRTDLPASVLGCPAWFNAEAVETLADAGEAS